MTRPPEPWHTRPGATQGLLVLGLHALLLAGLWQTLRHRLVPVPTEPVALLWLQAAPQAPPAAAPEQPRAQAAGSARPVAPALPPLPLPTGESQWVATAPEPPASAASAPPAERLLDSAATRTAIRQTGRQPLLHERVAQATDTPIRRTDTALAREVAEAAKPDCLKEPATGQIGPVGVGGILALPFLAARVARGDCAQ